MENLIRKGMTMQYGYYFSNNWGYYYSAGYLYCKKMNIPISNEFNIITS